jgi:hypothetical protein
MWWVVTYIHMLEYVVSCDIHMQGSVVSCDSFTKRCLKYTWAYVCLYMSCFCCDDGLRGHSAHTRRILSAHLLLYRLSKFWTIYTFLLMNRGDSWKFSDVMSLTWVYIYVCMCMYVYIHIYTQYMHVYIYIYICVYKHIGSAKVKIRNIHMHTYMLSGRWTHLQLHTHGNAPRFTRHWRIHVWQVIYLCVYICIYICTMYMERMYVSIDRNIYKQTYTYADHGLTNYIYIYIWLTRMHTYSAPRMEMYNGSRVTGEYMSGRYSILSCIYVCMYVCMRVYLRMCVCMRRICDIHVFVLVSCDCLAGNIFNVLCMYVCNIYIYIYI